MKLTATLLLFAVIQVLAGESYSQTTTLSLDFEKASLSEVLKNIENESEYFFLYSPKMINVERQVSIQVENKKINPILDQLFQQTDVRYVVKDRQIVLTTEERISLLELPLQPRPVSGIVTDQAGAPMIGVTVAIKGTSQGTITDAQGRYSFQNIPENGILIFSFVGMKTQEVIVGSETSINTIMQVDAIGLEEVVAIGYGVVKRSDLTGAVSSVPMNLLRNQPVRGIEDMLQGRVAGMVLTRTSGQPGADIKIRIRGANSISGNNSPLTVVDGVIGGAIGSIHDVESIEVLKDASATAIYGERASNGVILITTKKAVSTVPKIRVSLNTGFVSQNTDYPDIMNAAEYAEFINDFRGAGTFSAAEIEEFRRTGGTDWPAAVMQTGIKNDHNVSYSQKVDKVGIYLSGRYSDEKGTMVNTNSGGNYQVRSNVSFDPSKRLSFNLDIKASKSQSRNGSLSQGSSKHHPLIQALIWSPTEPIWINEEEGIYNQTDHYGALLESPYMMAMEQNQLSMSSGVNSTLVANYKITDWLTYNATGYASKSSSHNATYQNSWLNPIDPQGSRSSGDYFSWRLINRVDLRKSFNDAHNILVTGVYEAEAAESWGLNGLGRNMPLADLASYYRIQMSNLQSTGSSFGESSRIAYLGRMNYNYMSRYYVTASYRVDAQSGPSDRPDDSKYGAFPSFAAAWRLSEESFLKDGFFNNLKLRFGWGLTGNPTGFPLTRMSGANFRYGLGANVLGYVPGTPANPNVKWEETSQTDIGLDATIINGKLSFTLDYFNKKTTDLLTSLELPGYFGYGGRASFTQNLGEINNKGFEATIDYTPIQTSNLFWSLNFNFSTVKNNVVSLGDQAAFLTGTTGNGFLDVYTYMVQEGMPLGTMWGYKFLGIWGTDEATEAAKYGEQPGDLKFEDVNNDGAINLADDGQIIGDANPKFMWGFSSVVTYKNFDFNILLQGMHGQDVYNLVRAAMSTVHADSRTVTLKEPAFNYWTPTNQNTEHPNIFSTSSKKRLNSTQWIEDGSWVKVKYVGLTYHLPRSIVNFGDLSFSLSGTDLLTFSKYKGYDPEVSASGTSDEWGGCDFGTFPIPRTVLFGVTLDF